MRYLLTVLVLPAMAVIPSLAAAEGAGGACEFGFRTTTAQQGTTTKQEAKAPQGERGDSKVTLVTQRGSK